MKALLVLFAAAVGMLAIVNGAGTAAPGGAGTALAADKGPRIAAAAKGPRLVPGESARSREMLTAKTGERST